MFQNLIWINSAEDYPIFETLLLMLFLSKVIFLTGSPSIAVTFLWWCSAFSLPLLLNTCFCWESDWYLSTEDMGILLALKWQYCGLNHSPLLLLYLAILSFLKAYLYLWIHIITLESVSRFLIWQNFMLSSFTSVEFPEWLLVKCLQKV